MYYWKTVKTQKPNISMNGELFEMIFIKMSNENKNKNISTNTTHLNRNKRSDSVRKKKRSGVDSTYKHTQTHEMYEWFYKWDNNIEKLNNIQDAFEGINIR